MVERGLSEGGVRDRGWDGGLRSGRIEMIDSSTYVLYTHHGPCRMSFHKIVHHYSSLVPQGGYLICDNSHSHSLSPNRLSSR